MHKQTHTENPQDIRQRSFDFSLRIIRIVHALPKNSIGYCIGDQLLRAGTSIGANIEETQSASTKKDFIHGITIALKEARETNYWLRLLNESNVFKKDMLTRILEENIEIIKILTVIRSNSKKK